MTRLLLFSLLYCLSSFFIQGALLRVNFPDLVVPDLILIFVVFLALRFRNLQSLILAFVLGLMFDFASARFLGPCAAAFSFAYLLVYLLVGRVFAGQYFVFSVLVFLASFAKSSFYLFFLRVFSVEELSVFEALPLFLFEALFTALCSPLVLYIFSRFFPERYRIAKRGI